MIFVVDGMVAKDKAGEAKIRVLTVVDSSEFKAALAGYDMKVEKIEGMPDKIMVEVIMTPTEDGKMETISARLLDVEGNNLNVKDITITYKGTDDNKKEYSAIFKGEIEDGVLQGKFAYEEGRDFALVTTPQLKDAKSSADSRVGEANKYRLETIEFTKDGKDYIQFVKHIEEAGDVIFVVDGMVAKDGVGTKQRVGVDNLAMDIAIGVASWINRGLAALVPGKLGATARKYWDEKMQETETGKTIDNVSSGTIYATIGGLGKLVYGGGAWLRDTFGSDPMVYSNRLTFFADMATTGVNMASGTDKRAEDITFIDALKVTMIPAAALGGIYVVSAIPIAVSAISTAYTGITAMAASSAVSFVGTTGAFVGATSGWAALATSASIFTAAQYMSEIANGQGLHSPINAITYGLTAGLLYTAGSVLVSGAAVLFARTGKTIEKVQGIKPGLFGWRGAWTALKSLFAAEPALQQAAWLQLSIKTFGIANVVLGFNAFGKGVVDPALSIWRAIDGDDVESGWSGWVYNSFKDFGQGGAAESWLTGLLFGGPFYFLGAASALSGRAFGRGVEALKKYLPKWVSNPVEAVKSLLDRAPNAVRYIGGALDEQLVEQPVSVFLQTTLHIPAGLAEIIVEFKPGGGIGPVKLNANTTISHIESQEGGGAVSVKVAEKIQIDSFATARLTESMLEEQRIESISLEAAHLLELIPMDVRTDNAITEETVGKLTLADYAAYSNISIAEAAFQAAERDINVTEAAYYAAISSGEIDPIENMDINIAELTQNFAKECGLTLTETTTIEITRTLDSEANISYALSNLSTKSEAEFTDIARLNEALSQLTNRADYEILYNDMKLSTPDTTLSLSETQVTDDTGGLHDAVILTETYDTGRKDSITVRDDGEIEGRFMNIGDYYFNIKKDVNEITHKDTYSVEAGNTQILSNKEREELNEIVDGINNELRFIEESDYFEDIKGARKDEGVNQVSAVLANLFTDNVFHRIPTGVGKTSYIFAATALINAKVFGKKTAFIVNSTPELNKNKDPERGVNKTLEGGWVVIDQTTDYSKHQYDVHVLSNPHDKDYARAMKAIKEAKVFYMTQASWQFLSLEVRKSLGSDSAAYKAWDTIFSNTKVLMDEVDTAFIATRAQSGLESKRLKGYQKQNLYSVFDFLHNIEIETEEGKMVKILELPTYQERLEAYRSLLTVSVETIDKNGRISYEVIPYFDYDMRKSSKENIRMVGSTFNTNVLNEFKEWLDKKGYHVKDVHTLEEDLKGEALKEALGYKEALYGFSKSIQQIDVTEVGVGSLKEYPGIGLTHPSPGSIVAEELHLSNPYYAGATELVFKEHRPEYDENLDNVTVSGKATVTVLAESIRRAVESGASIGGFSGTLTGVTDLAYLIYGIEVRFMGEKFDYKRKDKEGKKNIKAYTIGSSDVALGSTSKKGTIFKDSEDRSTVIYEARFRTDQTRTKAKIIEMALKEGYTIIAKDERLGWTKHTLENPKGEEIVYESDKEDNVKKYRELHRREKVLFYYNLAATRGTDVLFTEEGLKAYALIDSSTTSWAFEQLAGRDRGIKEPNPDNLNKDGKPIYDFVKGYDENGKPIFIQDGDKKLYHDLDVYLIDKTVEEREEISLKEESFKEADKAARELALYNNLADILDNKTAERFYDLAINTEDSNAKETLLQFADQYQAMFGVPSDLTLPKLGKSGREALEEKIEKALKFYRDIQATARFKRLPKSVKDAIKAEAETNAELILGPEVGKRMGGRIAYADTVSEVKSRIKKNISEGMLPRTAPLSGESKTSIKPISIKQAEYEMTQEGLTKEEASRFISKLEAKKLASTSSDIDIVTSAGVRAMKEFLNLSKKASIGLLNSLATALLKGASDIEDGDDDEQRRARAEEVTIALIDVLTSQIPFVLASDDFSGIVTLINTAQTYFTKGTISATPSLSEMRQAVSSYRDLASRELLLKYLKQNISNRKTRTLYKAEAKEIKGITRGEKSDTKNQNRSRYYEFIKDDPIKAWLGLPMQFSHRRFIGIFTNAPIILSMMLKPLFGKQSILSGLTIPLYIMVGGGVLPYISKGITRAYRKYALPYTNYKIAANQKAFRKARESYKEGLFSRLKDQDPEVIAAAMSLIEMKPSVTSYDAVLSDVRAYRVISEKIKGAAFSDRASTLSVLYEIYKIKDIEKTLGTKEDFVKAIISGSIEITPEIATAAGIILKQKTSRFVLPTRKNWAAKELATLFDAQDKETEFIASELLAFVSGDKNNISKRLANVKSALNTYNRFAEFRKEYDQARSSYIEDYLKEKDIAMPSFDNMTDLTQQDIMRKFTLYQDARKEAAEVFDESESATKLKQRMEQARKSFDEVRVPVMAQVRGISIEETRNIIAMQPMVDALEPDAKLQFSSYQEIANDTGADIVKVLEYADLPADLLISANNSTTTYDSGTYTFTTTGRGDRMSEFANICTDTLSLAQELKTKHPEYAGMIDAIIALWDVNTANGAKVQILPKHKSNAEKITGQVPTIAFDADFADFIIDAYAQDRDAARLILFERLGHELTHTSYYHGTAEAEAYEEFISTYTVDYNIAKILEEDQDLKTRITRLFVENKDKIKFTSGHFYQDVMEAKIMQQSEADGVNELWRYLVERKASFVQGEYSQKLEQLLKDKPDIYSEAKASLNDPIALSRTFEITYGEQEVKAVTEPSEQSKPSSAGLLNEALEGLDTEYADSIRIVVASNNVEITEDGSDALGAVVDDRITLPIELIEVISLLNKRGIDILQSIIAYHNAPEEEKLSAQASVLHLTISETVAVRANLIDLITGLEQVKAKIRTSEQKKALTDAIYSISHEFEKKGGTLEDMKRDLLDITGIPLQITTAILNPVFAIMSQVIKPKMSALEITTTVIEFGTDTAMLMAKIYTAATYDGPGQINVSGRIEALSASELTKERAQIMKVFLDSIPKDKRTDVTITTYGDPTEESIEAQNILGTYYKPIEKLTHAKQATVVYTEGTIPLAEKDLPADSVRFIEVARPGKGEYIPDTTLLYAMFEMPFRQFIRTYGDKIGISKNEQEILFADSNTYAGTIRIKPVDKDKIKRISELVAQNA